MDRQLTRLRRLVEAGIAMTSELSLDAVLQRVVESAAELTQARYGALGVIDPGGSRTLERFLTTGIPPEQAQEIGHPPVGRGILGVLIDEAKPLRLHDLTQDPRSVGFPPGHPPMKTFLGVPIVLRGVAYGNLYLTDKAGGADFTEEDEEVVSLLASQAAVAIENARLYESATRWMHQLETLAELGNAIASETDVSVLLDLVATRLRELVGARCVFVMTPSGDDLVVVAEAHEGAHSGVGVRMPVASSKAGRALERRRVARVDTLLEDVEVDRAALKRLADSTGLPMPSTGLWVPLVVRNRAIGVIALHDKIGRGDRGLRFTDEDVRIAEAFGQRAAVAIDLSERMERDALARVMAAQELERKRIARELHDETGQALTSILLGLRTIEDAQSLEEARAAVATLRETVVETLRDVRRLALALRPTVLDDFGLLPALEHLVESFREQTGMQVGFEAHLDEQERLSSEAETALYRIVQEALTNVLKHARATRVDVVLMRKDDGVTLVVEDNGRGIDPDQDGDGEGGLGLLGMRERLTLLNGRLTVESSPGAGTTLVAEVPVA